MAQNRQSTSALRAWILVLTIVFVMAMLIAWLLLLRFDVPMVLVAGTGLVLVGICGLMVMSGYHILLPTIEEIRSLHDKDELRAAARILFVPVVDDEDELRASIISVLEESEGSRRIWVAPPRLLAVVDAISRRTPVKVSSATDCEDAAQEGPTARRVRKLRKY